MPKKKIIKKIVKEEPKENKIIIKSPIGVDEMGQVIEMLNKRIQNKKITKG